MRLVEKIHTTSISLFNKLSLMTAAYVLFWLIAFSRHETPWLGLRVRSAFITIADVLIFLLIIGAVLFFIFNKTSSKAKWMSIGGLIYISLSLGLMTCLFQSIVSIRVGDTSLTITNAPYFYPASIIAALWINDTMAYIIGSLIGKTPLSKISPKKTWEGTISGIILSGGLVFLISFAIFHFIIVGYALMILAIIAAITGTLGDLFESKLKRMAGVKDSGHIMPGHGGFLDRFDSLLIATPFVWLYVYFFMQ